MGDMIFEVPLTEFPKLPTLLQFLKTPQSNKLKARYLVKAIWFPKDYPNLTFETENFRVLVHENNPIYSDLIAFASRMAADHTPFAIQVNAQRDGTFGITTSAEVGEWEKIGERGFKLKLKGTEIKRK